MWWFKRKQEEAGAGEDHLKEEGSKNIFYLTYQSMFSPKDLSSTLSKRNTIVQVSVVSLWVLVY